MTVYARVSGGLGNQLFQLAAGGAIATSLGTDLVVDPSGIYFANQRGTATTRTFLSLTLLPELKVISTDSLPQSLKLQLSLGHGRSKLGTIGSTVAHALDSLSNGSQSIFWDSDVQSLLALVSNGTSERDLHLNGYWANHTLVALGDSWMRSNLRPGVDIRGKKASIRDEISLLRSTAVHVRRGDFLSEWATDHNVTSKQYFRAAMDKLVPITDKFYVFSDDIEWCAKNLTDNSWRVEFIVPERGETDADHLMLMSQCQNFIISNSSFSWWAAWLSTNMSKTVVRPTSWTIRDSGETIYPPTWEPFSPE